MYIYSDIIEVLGAFQGKVKIFFQVLQYFSRFLPPNPYFSRFSRYGPIFPGFPGAVGTLLRAVQVRFDSGLFTFVLTPWLAFVLTLCKSRATHVRFDLVALEEEAPLAVILAPVELHQ